MRWRQRWTRLRRSLLHGSQDDRDLDDEIRFHLEQEAELRADRGTSIEQARREARLAFGNIAATKETMRAVWVASSVEECVRDIRLGWRILPTAPGLSAAAIILVALVVGANITVFSVAHGVLKKPAPGVTAHDVVRLNWITEHGFAEPTSSYVAYQELSSQSTVVQPIMAFEPYVRMSLGLESGTHAVNGTLVSRDYFDTLGVSLVRGRSFTEAEIRGDASGLVAVISDRIWHDLFERSDDIIGQPVSISGSPATVIGVAASGFRGALLAEAVDVWVPIVSYARTTARGRSLVDPADDRVAIMGRMASRASIADAEAELQTIWARLQAAYPDLKNRRLVLIPYSAVSGAGTGIAHQGDRLLAILSIISLLTLLVVCANVANLLIARAATRQRELAVRLSLGASQLRIVRMLLSEGVVIAVLATSAAFACAWWVSRSLRGFAAPGPWAAVGEMDFTPSWTVVSYAAVLAALSAVAFTVSPALRTRHINLLSWLKAGEQGVVRGRSSLSSGLVVTQLALSVLLMTSAGLAYRSLSLLEDADPGFDTRDLLLVTINTSGSATSAGANVILLEALAERIRALPGVTALSYARLPPFRDGGWPDSRIQTPGGQPLDVDGNHVGPEYFRTLGISTVLGREFGRQATAGPVNTAVVSQSLAMVLWPNQAPIGQRLQVQQQPDTQGAGAVPLDVEVIGVVPDVAFSRFRDIQRRFLFLSAMQEPAAPGETTLYVRYGSGSLDVVSASISRSIREIDSRTAIESVQTVDARRRAGAWPFRALTMLLTLFAGASLCIAAIGQYAVVSFEMRSRVREFGVKMALGASTRDVAASVLQQGFAWTTAGLIIGFGLSVATGRVLAGALYGITPTDPVTYGSVFGMLAATSVLACYLPARRAARIDPIRALRYE